MKTCSKCKTDYSTPLEDHFNKKKGTKDGFQYLCKKCVAVFHKEHYEKRTQYYIDKAYLTNQEYRLRNLQYMVDYLKENACIDCGEKDPVVLEFDHRGDKKYNVSSLTSGSMETLLKEIAKRDVRCANCHKRKTAKQFDYYKGITL
jgi:hypothetical protein